MKLYSEEEIVEFLTNTYPGPLGDLEHAFKNEEGAHAAWQGWVEHMAAGDYPIGREVD